MIKTLNYKKVKTCKTKSNLKKDGNLRKGNIVTIMMIIKK